MSRAPSAATRPNEEAAERLRRRYPGSRVPRPLLLGLIGLVALTALGFWIWIATFHSRPEVAGNVTAYTVRSDSEIAVTLTVDRPDPSIPATCRVIAQATDFTVVAEQAVQVPAAATSVVNLELRLTTLRRATSASVRECST